MLSSNAKEAGYKPGTLPMILMTCCSCGILYMYTIRVVNSNELLFVNGIYVYIYIYIYINLEFNFCTKMILFHPTAYIVLKNLAMS